jgi:hypothetical protein
MSPMAATLPFEALFTQNMSPHVSKKIAFADFSRLYLSFLGFLSKIDFLVIKITNCTHQSGYLGNVGALGPKMSTPKA